MELNAESAPAMKTLIIESGAPHLVDEVDEKMYQIVPVTHAIGQGNSKGYTDSCLFFSMLSNGSDLVSQAISFKYKNLNDRKVLEWIYQIYVKATPSNAHLIKKALAESRPPDYNHMIPGRIVDKDDPIRLGEIYRLELIVPSAGNKFSDMGLTLFKYLFDVCRIGKATLRIVRISLEQ